MMILEDHRWLKSDGIQGLTETASQSNFPNGKQTKTYDFEMAAYLASLCQKVLSATWSAAVLEAEMHDTVSMSITIVSQARQPPALPKMRVGPSGHLLSDLNRPASTLTDRMLAHSESMPDQFFQLVMPYRPASTDCLVIIESRHSCFTRIHQKGMQSVPTVRSHYSNMGKGAFALLWLSQIYQSSST